MPRTGYFIAIATAILSAVVFPWPAAGDHVAGEEPYFTCRASVARAELLRGNPIPTIEPLAANANREECAEDTAGAPTIALPPAPEPDPAVRAGAVQASTEILCATDDPDPNVTPTNNDQCDAGRRSFEQQVVSRADAADVEINAGDVRVQIQAANTTARARCGPGNVPVLSSTSNVANITVTIGDAPPIQIQLPPANQETPIDLGAVRLILNEEIVEPATQEPNAQGEFVYPDAAPSGQVTRRAVHVLIPGGTGETAGDVADVVVAESIADFHGDVCPEGRIVIRKETVPDQAENTTVFPFTSPGLTPASFTLTDDDDQVFEEVQPSTPQDPGRTYAVTEAAGPGQYSLAAINCAENRTPNTATDVATRTATINVGPGETVTCTFINAVCPPGSQLNQNGQCVILQITCPEGSTLNNQGQCIINTTTCPPGSTRPDATGPCIVTNITCPPGSTGPNQQGQCISNTTTCPNGTTNQQGQCVVNTITCPPGTAGPNQQGQCVNNTLTCPPGSTNQGGQCVVNQPNCPPGTTRNAQGQCIISNIQCPAGTTFNPVTLGCTEAPRGGTLVPLNIPQIAQLFRGSPCLGEGFGPLVGIIGTNGPDRITGTNASDRIFALLGNDRVSGGRGDDCIEGGGGRDVLDGSNGNDFLLGGTGNDQVNGGPGRDRFTGGSGRDVMSGGTGNDNMNGGAGRDRLQGGFGNDRLVGGAGNDGIHTGNGIDRVSAGPGNDIINAATRGPAATVDCGPGLDRVRINNNERRRIRNCELVDIFRRIARRR